MSDPFLNPQPGDCIKTYNSFMDVWVTRKVVQRRGCRVIFLVDSQVYSICVDLWQSLVKGGSVVDESEIPNS